MSASHFGSGHFASGHFRSGHFRPFQTGVVTTPTPQPGGSGESPYHRQLLQNEDEVVLAAIMSFVETIQ